MVERGVGIMCDGATDEINRDIEPPNLVGDDSEQMQAIGVSWEYGQHLPIKPICLSQATGVMMLHGGRECGVEVRREIFRPVFVSAAGFGASGGALHVLTGSRLPYNSGGHARE